VERQLRIAGVVLGIESREVAWDFEPGGRYAPFLVHGLGEDVHVGVHWRALGLDKLGEEVLSVRESPNLALPNWQLLRHSQDGWALRVNTSAYAVFRQRIALFQSDFRRGDVYVELADHDLAVYPYPLTTPLDRVLFVNLLARGLGVMLHACGVVKDGKGYVFSGPPDAGKTTLARLVDRFSDGMVLGDECVIIRRKGNRFWVYGTPWYGEAGLHSPQGAPLEQLFLIHHARKNLCSPIPAQEAASRLLAQSILTPYDAAAVEFGLDFCLSLIAEVPAYDFGFVPEASAVRQIARIWGDV
jgi:hypothetical protein